MIHLRNGNYYVMDLTPVSIFISEPKVRMYCCLVDLSFEVLAISYEKAGVPRYEYDLQIVAVLLVVTQSSFSHLIQK